MDERSELERLRLENARLKELLARHGVREEERRDAAGADPDRPRPATAGASSAADKIALFRRLFRGRDDVHAVRWESAKGASGYSVACANEWRPGVCRKPKIRCGDCAHRSLLPVTDRVIYDHLAGRSTVGVYPLLPDDHCRFLAVDFDGKDWRADILALARSCRELDVPAAAEISRSGRGAHLWLFFSAPVPARLARHLGAALISHTCGRTRQLSLSSYDRMFPNQDTMPKGGFGNLIALPLQKAPRAAGRSVFVDDGLRPWPDQWAFLDARPALSPEGLEAALGRACAGRHPLDVAFASGEAGAAPAADRPPGGAEPAGRRKPWERPAAEPARLPGPLPPSLKLVLADGVYFAKNELTPPLSNRLVRLAAFQNPAFYRNQAMRLSVWNTPRVIGCAENHPDHIGLPRGCLDGALKLLKDNGIKADIQDERLSGGGISAHFVGTLRGDQEAAAKAVLARETGVLCAPTAFGKTVTAAAVIARRGVSALVLVHRTELMRQWRERLDELLELRGPGPGALGGGENALTGAVDVAVMQSLSRREDLGELLDGYGQIVVDECHHISALSFESVLKQSKARFVLGLTATPQRRDGHHPIIFMQCGPVRHQAARPDAAPSQLKVFPRLLDAPEVPRDAGIQDVFRAIAGDGRRARRIADDIAAAFREGRKILALTERSDHLGLLRDILSARIETLFVLHGRMPGKERAQVLEALRALDGAAPRVLLATGRLIGEGFDHPALDTLMLAMPISWKGTLQQYAGRLHRACAGKRDVRIYDYVETGQPALERMWRKRRLGYRAMGYDIMPGGEPAPGAAPRPPP